MSNNLTISRLGERKTINKLVEIFSSKEDDKVVVLGACDNDDVALLDIGKGYLLVSTTDTMTISTHKPTGATFRQFGWYATAANLSDIACKGAVPIGMMFAFGIPRDFYIDDLLEVAKGIKDCTLRYKTSVIGGDTKYNREFTLTGVALGRVRKNEFIPRRARKKVRVGDLIYTTGKIGKAAYAFYACKEKMISEKECAKIMMCIKPRFSECRKIASLNLAKSSMDLSDSLAECTTTLACMNQCEITLYEKRLPFYNTIGVEKLMKKGITKEDLISYGGDFELIFIIDKEKDEVLNSKIDKKKYKLSRIGKVTSVGKDSSQVYLYDGNKRKILEPRSFQHF